MLKIKLTRVLDGKAISASAESGFLYTVRDFHTSRASIIKANVLLMSTEPLKPIVANFSVNNFHLRPYITWVCNNSIHEHSLPSSGFVNMSTKNRYKYFSIIDFRDETTVVKFI